MKLLKNIFNWDIKDVLRCLIGSFLFCFAINFFVVPNHLYTGGVLGLSELLRSIIIDIFNLNTTFDFSGIIYYLINIPLFAIAYKSLGKTFFFRTLFAVSIQALLLSIIPTKQVVDDVLTNVFVGGLIGGAGVGILLSSGASTGGTDIIGLTLSKKNNNFSVGKLGLMINFFIYIVAGIRYGIEIMIYSIIYSAVDSLMVDKLHEQNICSTAVIFTKKKPDKIINFIQVELDRDVTWWEGVGSHDDTKTYICYAVLSKYELMRLERHLNVIDSSAFVVTADGVGIRGNFQKKLT